MRNLRLWGFGLIAGLIGVLVLPLMASTAPASQPDQAAINALTQRLHDQEKQIRDLQQELANKEAIIRNLKRQLSILPRVLPPMKSLPFRTPIKPIPSLPGDVIPLPGRLPPGTVQRQFNGAPVYEIPIRQGAKRPSQTEATH